MGQSRMQAAYDRAFRFADCRLNRFFCWSLKAFTNALIASNPLDLARSLLLAGGAYHLLADCSAGCIEHNLKRARLIPAQDGERIFRLQVQVC